MKRKDILQGLLIICLFMLFGQYYEIKRPLYDYERNYFTSFLLIQEPKEFELENITEMDTGEMKGSHFLSITYSVTEKSVKTFIKNLGKEWFGEIETPGKNDWSERAKRGIYTFGNAKRKCSMFVEYQKSNNKLKLTIEYNL